jgi:hypothetical protein
MRPNYTPVRRHTAWYRQLALVLLFALQGAITLSPLIEPSEKGRMGAHAEERGARHKYQHDEATCAVCAVRSLHAAATQTAAPIIGERVQTAAALDTPVAPTRRADATVLPRAPPQLT